MEILKNLTFEWSSHQRPQLLTVLILPCQSLVVTKSSGGQNELFYGAAFLIMERQDEISKYDAWFSII